MKKIGLILIFIFLTGLFSGIFFSTNLSQTANDTLSALMLTSFSDSDAGFLKAFTSSIISNFTLFIIMIPALFTKYLKPVPVIVLWYKSFAIGFCSGLIYINAASQALLISVTKILPQNLFIIPSFIIFTAAVFLYPVHSNHNFRHINKKNRPTLNGPLMIFALSSALLIIGAFTEAVFHLIAL
ncbi:MAG: stage II sporulation protein M [Anaerovoracaceae bacterium]